MPNRQEVEELINKCKWEKIITPSVGYDYLSLKAIGPNGRSILLSTDYREEFNQYHLSFWTSSEGESPFAFKFICNRYYLLRPLYEGALKIKSNLSFEALKVIPVADKKWQGKL